MTYQDPRRRRVGGIPQVPLTIIWLKPEEHNIRVEKKAGSKRGLDFKGQGDTMDKKLALEVSFLSDLTMELFFHVSLDSGREMPTQLYLIQIVASALSRTIVDSVDEKADTYNKVGTLLFKFHFTVESGW